MSSPGSLLSDGPVQIDPGFDPLTLYDQIYPQWRTGPGLPVDPATQAMPADPASGGTGSDATNFPTGFADVTGMGGEMPSLAGFDFTKHDPAAPAAPSTGQGISDLVYPPALGEGTISMTPLPNASLNGEVVIQPLASQEDAAAPDASAVNPDNSVIVTGQNARAAAPQQGSTPPGTSPEQAAQFNAFKGMMADPNVEGRRNDVYIDSRGIPTVGIGHKVLPGDNLKVGDVISDDRVDQLFAQDAAPALASAKSQAAGAGISDPAFIPSLASVNFQLGGTTWPGKFRHTWQMVKDGQYDDAADALENSPWNKQTPSRVKAFQGALRALPPKPAR